MKTALMTYCQKAYSAALAGEAFGCKMGVQLGYTQPARYAKNTELAKYQKKVVFPPNLGLVPVAVFTVGVTWRLVTAWVSCAILRAAMALSIKAGHK